jgi:7,8-dihydro-6-hydroxymethylpterin-pyrophosphokinase
MNSDVLIIPHPEILNRDFILENLIELNPELRDPRTGEKYSLLHNQKKEKVKDLPQS